MKNAYKSIDTLEHNLNIMFYVHMTLLIFNIVILCLSTIKTKNITMLYVSFITVFEMLVYNVISMRLENKVNDLQDLIEENTSKNAR